MNKFVLLISCLVISNLVFCQNQINYQTPPQPILELLNAKTTPQVFTDKQGKWLLQANEIKLLPITEIAKKELGLAGLRINPASNSKSLKPYFDTLILTSVTDGRDFLITGLPQNALLSDFLWSNCNKFIAFTNTTHNGTELWFIDVLLKKAEKITGAIINNTLCSQPLTWVNNKLLFAAVCNNGKLPPELPIVPIGPVVMQSSGTVSAVRTYQNLLTCQHDEKLFEYYTYSQITLTDLKGNSKPIGKPGLYLHVKPSPDNNYILVSTIKKPFSYIVPYTLFAHKTEIWDIDGNLYRELFNIPLTENLPAGFSAVPKGPRNVNWNPCKPSSLYWVMAVDGGDPKKSAAIRDRLFTFDHPFDNKGVPSAGFEKRFGNIYWIDNNNAITMEYEWETRTETISKIDLSNNTHKKQLLFEYNWQDLYNHPGKFMLSYNNFGQPVIATDKHKTNIFLQGNGESPQGAMPFIDKYNLATGKTDRLWQSNNPYYEKAITFIDAQKGVVLTSRESVTDPPNYFARNITTGEVNQLTNYQNPYPQLSKVKQQFLKYKRADSVQLTATLYTPPGYSVGDGLLPVIIWAYPYEYKTTASAGQVKSSPNKFIQISAHSPLFWIVQGYAVLDNTSMPIIGEGNNEPNDTFISQLTANAQAAVKCIDSMAIADINRIAIGGHSYGAFMTANLLAHTNLFAAGIARSGAYNRTLTPFGFQSEERTFWQAKQTYIDMSAFTYANKINEPVLFIHGDNDNNSGTFTMQSERMYSAVKGNGGTTRLVLLPSESHGYKAKESIYHMLWEMDTWLDKYVKNAPIK